MVGVGVDGGCSRCSWYWRGVLVRKAAMRGEGGDGVLVAVCLGIIYQIYCFLVLLLAAIAPHLALLLPVNLAPIPAAASL